MSNDDKNTPSLELIAARLAYVGSAITTLGDFIVTISAGIALKLVEQSESDSQTTVDATKEDLRQMNKQMDYLIRELRQIKKMMP